MVQLGAQLVVRVEGLFERIDSELELRWIPGLQHCALRLQVLVTQPPKRLPLDILPKSPRAYSSSQRKSLRGKGVSGSGGKG